MEGSHNNKWKYCMNPDYEKQHRRGKIWGGIIVLLVGGALLAKSLGVMMPLWLFHWPTILILVGIYILGKHGFKKPGGLIPLTVGLVFLIEKISPGMKLTHIIWPVLIMIFGIFMIMSPWRKRRKGYTESWQNATFTAVDNSDGDFMNIDSVFGGVEKNVISKNFKGGQVNCVFGGAEINLLQADIEGTVVMDVNCVFGGVDLTVPASWKIQTEISAILGGVEDKRAMVPNTMETNKILILKGSVVFGGVSIKGY